MGYSLTPAYHLLSTVIVMPEDTEELAGGQWQEGNIYQFHPFNDGTSEFPSDVLYYLATSSAPAAKTSLTVL